MSIKFRALEGVLGGGGSADLFFYGREDFPEESPS